MSHVVHYQNAVLASLRLRVYRRNTKKNHKKTPGHSAAVGGLGLRPQTPTDQGTTANGHSSLFSPESEQASTSYLHGDDSILEEEEAETPSPSQSPPSSPGTASPSGLKKTKGSLPKKGGDLQSLGDFDDCALDDTEGDRGGEVLSNSSFHRYMNSASSNTTGGYGDRLGHDQQHGGVDGDESTHQQLPVGPLPTILEFFGAFLGHLQSRHKGQVQASLLQTLILWPLRHHHHSPSSEQEKSESVLALFEALDALTELVEECIEAVGVDKKQQNPAAATTDSDKATSSEFVVECDQGWDVSISVGVALGEVDVVTCYETFQPGFFDASNAAAMQDTNNDKSNADDENANQQLDLSVQQFHQRKSRLAAMSSKLGAGGNSAATNAAGGGIDARRPLAVVFTGDACERATAAAEMAPGWGVSVDTVTASGCFKEGDRKKESTEQETSTASLFSDTLFNTGYGQLEAAETAAELSTALPKTSLSSITITRQRASAFHQRHGDNTPSDVTSPMLGGRQPSSTGSGGGLGGFRSETQPYITTPLSTTTAGGNSLGSMASCRSFSTDDLDLLEDAAARAADKIFSSDDKKRMVGLITFEISEPVATSDHTHQQDQASSASPIVGELRTVDTLSDAQLLQLALPELMARVRNIVAAHGGLLTSVEVDYAPATVNNNDDDAVAGNRKNAVTVRLCCLLENIVASTATCHIADVDALCVESATFAALQIAESCSRTNFETGITSVCRVVLTQGTYPRLVVTDRPLCGGETVLLADAIYKHHLPKSAVAVSPSITGESSIASSPPALASQDVTRPPSAVSSPPPPNSFTPTQVSKKNPPRASVPFVTVDSVTGHWLSFNAAQLLLKKEDIDLKDFERASAVEASSGRPTVGMGTPPPQGDAAPAATGPDAHEDLSAIMSPKHMKPKTISYWNVQARMLGTALDCRSVLGPVRALIQHSVDEKRRGHAATNAGGASTSTFGPSNFSGGALQQRSSLLSNAIHGHIGPRKKNTDSPDNQQPTTASTVSEEEKAKSNTPAFTTRGLVGIKHIQRELEDRLVKQLHLVGGASDDGFVTVLHGPVKSGRTALVMEIAKKFSLIPTLVIGGKESGSGAVRLQQSAATRQQSKRNSPAPQQAPTTPNKTKGRSSHDNLTQLLMDDQQNVYEQQELPLLREIFIQLRAMMHARRIGLEKLPPHDPVEVSEWNTQKLVDRFKLHLHILAGYGKKAEATSFAQLLIVVDDADFFSHNDDCKSLQVLQSVLENFHHAGEEKSEGGVAGTPAAEAAPSTIHVAVVLTSLRGPATLAMTSGLSSSADSTSSSSNSAAWITLNGTMNDQRTVKSILQHVAKQLVDRDRHGEDGELVRQLIGASSAAESTSMPTLVLPHTPKSTQFAKAVGPHMLKELDRTLFIRSCQVLHRCVTESVWTAVAPIATSSGAISMERNEDLSWYRPHDPTTHREDSFNMMHSGPTFSNNTSMVSPFTTGYLYTPNTTNDGGASCGSFPMTPHISAPVPFGTAVSPGGIDASQTFTTKSSSGQHQLLPLVLNLIEMLAPLVYRACEARTFYMVELCYYLSDNRRKVEQLVQMQNTNATGKPAETASPKDSQSPSGDRYFIFSRHEHNPKLDALRDILDFQLPSIRQLHCRVIQQLSDAERGWLFGLCFFASATKTRTISREVAEILAESQNISDCSSFFASCFNARSTSTPLGADLPNDEQLDHLIKECLGHEFSGLFHYDGWSVGGVDSHQQSSSFSPNESLNASSNSGNVYSPLRLFLSVDPITKTVTFTSLLRPRIVASLSREGELQHFASTLPDELVEEHLSLAGKFWLCCALSCTSGDAPPLGHAMLHVDEVVLDVREKLKQDRKLLRRMSRGGKDTAKQQHHSPPAPAKMRERNYSKGPATQGGLAQLDIGSLNTVDEVLQCFPTKKKQHTPLDAAQASTAFANQEVCATTQQATLFANSIFWTMAHWSVPSCHCSDSTLSECILGSASTQATVGVKTSPATCCEVLPAHSTVGRDSLLQFGKECKPYQNFLCVAFGSSVVGDAASDEEDDSSSDDDQHEQEASSCSASKCKKLPRRTSIRPDDPDGTSQVHVPSSAMKAATNVSSGGGTVATAKERRRATKRANNCAMLVSLETQIPEVDTALSELHRAINSASRSATATSAFLISQRHATSGSGSPFSNSNLFSSSATPTGVPSVVTTMPITASTPTSAPPKNDRDEAKHQLHHHADRCKRVSTSWAELQRLLKQVIAISPDGFDPKMSKHLTEMESLVELWVGSGCGLPPSSCLFEDGEDSVTPTIPPLGEVKLTPPPVMNLTDNTAPSTTHQDPLAMGREVTSPTSNSGSASGITSPVTQLAYDLFPKLLAVSFSANADDAELEDPTQPELPTARTVALELSELINATIQLVRDTVTDVCERMSPGDSDDGASVLRTLKTQSTDHLSVSVLRHHHETLCEVVQRLYICHQGKSRHLKRISTGVEAMGDGTGTSDAQKAVRELGLCVQHATHYLFYEALFEESLFRTLPSSILSSSVRSKHRAAHASLMTSLVTFGSDMFSSMALNSHDLLQTLLHTAILHIRCSDSVLCDAIVAQHGDIQVETLYNGSIQAVLPPSRTAAQQEEELRMKESEEFVMVPFCECEECLSLYWLKLPKESTSGMTPIEKRKKELAAKSAAGGGFGGLKQSAGGWRPRARANRAPAPPPPED